MSTHRSILALLLAVSCGSRTGLDAYAEATDGNVPRDAMGRVDASRPDASRHDVTAHDAGDGASHPRESGGRDAPFDRSLSHDAGTDGTVDARDSPGPRDAGVDQLATMDAGLTPPRLIAPLSTSRVTSRRPTLRWVLPDGVSDATVDLCHDRACTDPIAPPVLVTGTSYAPDADLPVGVVFWRLHPSIESSVTSATWELTVGPRSAPVDSSWGSTFDVNGDGHADLILTAASGTTFGPGSRTAFVFEGGPGGVAAEPSTTFSLTGDGAFVPIGDVNGDGYADVGFSTLAGSTLAIYLGGAAGLASAPTSTLTIAGGVNDAGSPYYVTALTTAGDVNGDGYGDLVVGTYEVGVGGADVSIQLFLGGPASLAPIPAVSLTFEANLWGVAGVAGDVNGDGYGDLVVPLDSPVFAGVPRDFVVDELYPGGPSGWPAAPAVFATQVSTDPQPDYPLGLADVNGDGYADLPVLSDYSAAAGGGGALCSYLGGASGFLPTPLCTGAVSSTDGFATGGIATVGDVNGDGYADVLAGGNVYLGGPDGLAATPSAAAPYGVIYADVVSAGDLDGDGYSDIAVLLAGHVDVYRGGPGGLAGVPAATLLAVDDAGDKGVYAVYGATN